MRNQFFVQANYQSIPEPTTAHIPRPLNQTEMVFVESIRVQRRKSIQAAITLYNELQQTNIDLSDLSTFRQYIESYNENCRNFRQDALETPAYNFICSSTALSPGCLSFISKQRLEAFQKIQNDIGEEEAAERMRFFSEHARLLQENDSFIKLFNLIFFVTLLGMLVPSDLRKSAAYGFVVNLLWGVPYVYYKTQIGRLHLDEIYPTGDYFSAEELSVQFNNVEIMQSRL